MANTTKSPLKVAQTALAIGQQALAQYGHRNSPKKFTQAQLFAVLALREFFGTDYRGIVAILQDSTDLRSALQLDRLPNFSTLCYAQRRFEKRGLRVLADGVG
jgi:Transposase domain (DUF772)